MSKIRSMDCKESLIDLEALDGYGGESKRKRDMFRRKYKTNNPNCFLPIEKLTVFEKILKTPNSSDDIMYCLENGARLYKVRSDSTHWMRSFIPD